MKITQFDKPTCKTIGMAMEQALQKVGEEFGVSIKRKSGSFTHTNFTIKIEASVVGQNGVVLSREANNFKSYCGMYNLKPSDLGRTFTSDDGTTYKVTGLSTRSDKYPILAESLKNGRVYKLPERMVQRGLGKTVKPLTADFRSRSDVFSH